MLDKPGNLRYNNTRKREIQKGDTKMKKFEVSAFRMDKDFEDFASAKKFFDEVKSGFGYCELKSVIEDNGVYISESVEIFRK